MTTTRTWVGPSSEPTELHEPVYGAAVDASTVMKSAAPTGLTWKATAATPEVASCATAANAIVPLRSASAAGVVTAPLSGEVLSTVFGESATVVALPAVSVTISSTS